MTVRNLPTPEDKSIQRIVAALRSVAFGRSNSTGSVTLRTAPNTTTVVEFQNCSSESQVFLTPATLNAAAALGTAYISSVGNGTFTITHAASAATDRTFGFACIG